jgi:hypothetical protein
MNSILSIDQERVIVDDFNHLFICLEGLALNINLLTLLKLIRDMNSPLNRCRDCLLSNFFQNSYFTDGRLEKITYSVYHIMIFFIRITSGGVVTELLIPFLRFVSICIMIWFTFKCNVYIIQKNSVHLSTIILSSRATTFYHVHYPIIKRYIDEMVRLHFVFYAVWSICTAKIFLNRKDQQMNCKIFQRIHRMTKIQ